MHLLDRRSYTNRRAVKKLLWALFGVENIIVQIFRPVWLVVLAAESKRGFGSLIAELTLMGGL